MKDSQLGLPHSAHMVKYIKESNERFSTWLGGVVKAV